MDSAPALKKVLLIEDLRHIQADWIKKLEGKVLIISAFTIAEARQKFKEHPDVGLITMDGCVDNDQDIDTESLTREIRETFSGPMIAASKAAVYRQWLVRAGCSHQCHKDDVPKKILEVLGIS